MLYMSYIFIVQYPIKSNGFPRKNNKSCSALLWTHRGFEQYYYHLKYHIQLMVLDQAIKDFYKDRELKPGLVETLRASCKGTNQSHDIKFNCTLDFVF